jgi:hypothetical protein
VPELEEQERGIDIDYKSLLRKYRAAN